MATRTPKIKKVTIKRIDWTPALIKENIEKYDIAVKNALLRVYSWQTEEEQQIEQTKESNGIGFNGVDSFILSSFAEQLIKKGYLSPRQIALARKKMVKYSTQIFNYLVAERKEVAKGYGLG